MAESNKLVNPDNVKCIAYNLLHDKLMATSLSYNTNATSGFPIEYTYEITAKSFKEIEWKYELDKNNQIQPSSFLSLLKDFKNGLLEHKINLYSIEINGQQLPVEQFFGGTHVKIYNGKYLYKDMEPGAIIKMLVNDVVINENDMVYKNGKLIGIIVAQNMDDNTIEIMTEGVFNIKMPNKKFSAGEFIYDVNSQLIGFALNNTDEDGYVKVQLLLNDYGPTPIGASGSYNPFSVVDNSSGFIPYDTPFKAIPSEKIIIDTITVPDYFETELDITI